MKNESIIKPELSKISDINLAAALMLFVPLAKSEQIPEGKTLFCFENTTELEQIVTTYLNQKLLVNPVEFSNNLRTLKSIVHIGGTNAPS